MGLYPRIAQSYLTGIPRGKNSNVYIVDPANGSDTNPGDRFEQPLATLEAAYAKCVANQHDVVLYVAGSSGITLTAQLVWAKNYTHLIGLCAPTMVAQRARIFQGASATGLSPLVSITATGCIFKNLYIFQGVNDATSLINVEVSGGRNYFENCHFAGGGHAAQAIDGGASLRLNGAEENTFVDCVIGVDTIAAATGMAGMLMASAAARNVFRNCVFSLFAGHAAAKFIELEAITGIDRFTIFEDCLFVNLASTALTEAITIPAGFDSANKRLLLRRCVSIGATDWEGNNRGGVYLDNGVITGGGNAGQFVVSATA
jgi:hypothetical protein